MRKLVALLLMPLLASCVPEADSAPSLHDIAIFSNATDLRGLYTYIYGEPTELTIGGRTVTLTEGRSDAPLAVSGALLIDGEPYLKRPLARLMAPPSRVQRIPLTSDVQIEIGENSGITELVYFDGQRWLTIAQNPTATTGRRVVPRERLGGLQGLGNLTNDEAAALARALEPRAPVAVSVLPERMVPPRTVTGLSNYRRTALYVQQSLPTDAAAFTPPRQELVWEVIAQGSQAAPAEQASYQLITNDAQLTEAWSRAYGTRLDLPPLPDVDFRREAILAVFQATKPTGGYGIEIQSISVQQRDIYVDVREITPAPGSITTQALTTPWVLVRVLRGDISAAWFRDSASNRLIGVAQRVE